MDSAYAFCSSCAFSFSVPVAINLYLFLLLVNDSDIHYQNLQTETEKGLAFLFCCCHAFITHSLGALLSRWFFLFMTVMFGCFHSLDFIVMVYNHCYNSNHVTFALKT